MILNHEFTAIALAQGPAPDVGQVLADLLARLVAATHRPHAITADGAVREDIWAWPLPFGYGRAGR